MTASLVGHSHFVNRCTFSGDGKYIASASEDLSCKLFNASLVCSVPSTNAPVPSHDKLIKGKKTSEM